MRSWTNSTQRSSSPFASMQRKLYEATLADLGPVQQALSDDHAALPPNRQTSSLLPHFACRGHRTRARITTTYVVASSRELHASLWTLPGFAKGRPCTSSTRRSK